MSSSKREILLYFFQEVNYEINDYKQNKERLGKIENTKLI